MFKSFCIFKKKGITVKDLEDLIEKQKKLLNKLKEECKILNEQLEVLAIKYKYIFF